MFKLKQNTENTVVMTVNENSAISNPYYILSLTNQTTKKTTNLSINNTSNYDRYDCFGITLTGSTYADPENSIISLHVNGMYDYKVYESTGSTLHISATTGEVLEQGLCWVYDGISIENNENNIFYNNNNDKEIITYNG